MLKHTSKLSPAGRFSLGAAGVALVVGAAAGVRASAAPFDPKVVGKGAAWVVHVDVEAAMASAIGKHLLKNKEALEFDEAFGEMREELGIDPEKDVYSITVYGAEPDEDEDVDPTMVVLGSETIETQAIKLAEKHKELQKETIEGLTVYTVERGDEPMSVIVAPGPAANRRYLVTADTKERALWALKVVQGKAERITGEGLAPRPGSIVFGAATNMLRDLEFEPASNVLQHAEGGTIDIGEAGADIYADLTVKAESEQAAKDMTQVVSGLLAMGRMMVGENPEMQPLLEAAASIAPEAQGKTMRVQWKFPSAKASEAFDKMTKEHDGDHDDDGDHGERHEGGKREKKSL